MAARRFHPGGLFCAIGNPLNDGTWTYTWQNGRQLARMQSVDTDASFVYNENGLRVQKTVNGVVTKYTLHGKNVVHLSRENDELHFFYDAQNKPAVVVYNGVPYSYVKNLQGDIVAILDANGAVVVSYVYDAWGRPISCSGTMASTLGKINPFRYRGYVYDEETRLYYLRSRYYIPFLCRFINADSICTPNLFSYCKNSPILLSDPNGNISLLAIAGGIATLLAAVLTPSTAQAPDIPPAPSAEEIAEAQAVEKFFDDIGNELGCTMNYGLYGTKPWQYSTSTRLKSDGNTEALISKLIGFGSSLANGYLSTVLISNPYIGAGAAAITWTASEVATWYKHLTTPNIPNGIYTLESAKYYEDYGMGVSFSITYFYLHGVDDQGYYYSAIWYEQTVATPFDFDYTSYVLKQRD